MTTKFSYDDSSINSQKYSNEMQFTLCIEHKVTVKYVALLLACKVHYSACSYICQVCCRFMTTTPNLLPVFVLLSSLHC